MKGICILFLTLSVLLQGCNSVRYKKINLKEVHSSRLNPNGVSASRYLKTKLRNKKHPYKIYIHTIDSTGIQLAQFVTHVPSIQDTLLRGMFTPIDTADINLTYYQKLISKRDGNNCKIKVAITHRTVNLNQLHINIEDTARLSLYNPNGINVNTIKKLEKVKRFDKRWLWLTVGLPIFLFVFLYIYGAVIISQNFLKGGF